MIVFLLLLYKIFSIMKRKKGCERMLAHFMRVAVYIISVVLSMYGLSCFRFENYIKRGKIREFYIFYIVTSLGLAYLFAQFILSFVNMCFYA